MIYAPSTPAIIHQDIITDCVQRILGPKALRTQEKLMVASWFRQTEAEAVGLLVALKHAGQWLAVINGDPQAFTNEILSNKATATEFAEMVGRVAAACGADTDSPDSFVSDIYGKP